MPGPHRIFAGSSRPFCFTRTRNVSSPVGSNSRLFSASIWPSLYSKRSGAGAPGATCTVSADARKSASLSRASTSAVAGLDVERADPGPRGRHHLLGRAAGVLVTPERPGHEPGAAVAERDGEVGSADLDPPLALVGHRRHRRGARRDGARGRRRPRPAPVSREAGSRQAPAAAQAEAQPEKAGCTRSARAATARRRAADDVHPSSGHPSSGDAKGRGRCPRARTAGSARGGGA